MRFVALSRPASFTTCVVAVAPPRFAALHAVSPVNDPLSWVLNSNDRLRTSSAYRPPSAA